MKKTTAEMMTELFEYLGDDRWELGETIVDITEGARLLNPTFRAMMRKLFDSMPEPDDLTLEKIATHIDAVDTPFAKSVAADIRSAR